MESLKQEKLFESRYFKLHEDRVEIKIKNRRVESTVFINYEDITEHKNFVSEKLQPNYSMYVIFRNLAIVLLFCNLFGAIESWAWFLGCLCSSMVFFLFHVFTINQYTNIEVDSEQELTLLSSIPSSEEVDEFIEKIYAKRKEHLRKTYFDSCGPNTENAAGILNWLLEINVISRQEYDARWQFIDRVHP